MKIALDKIHDNPFRDLITFPPNDERIEALKQSILASNFWNNVVVRPHPKTKGDYQLAYGHHRIIAMREVGIKEAKFIVKKLTDADMLRVMTYENLYDWDVDTNTEQEAIAAIVRAYAEGVIDLPISDAVGGNISQTRYAPSFIKGAVPPHGAALPYTAKTIMSFLAGASGLLDEDVGHRPGWGLTKIQGILADLEALEKGGDPWPEDFPVKLKQKFNTAFEQERGRTRRQAMALRKQKNVLRAESVARYWNETEAEVRSYAGRLYRDGSLAEGDVGRVIMHVKKSRREAKPVEDFPHVDAVTQKLALKVGKLISSDTDLHDKIRQVTPFVDQMQPNTVASMQRNILATIGALQTFHDAFNLSLEAKPDRPELKLIEQ